MSAPSKNAMGKAALWSVANSALSQILVLVVFLITARFVSKEAFGIMAISYLLVEAYRQIVLQSIGTALTARKSPEDADYNASFIIIVLLSLFMSAVMYVGAPYVADFMGHEEVEKTLRLMCLLIVTTGLSKTHEVWLSRQLKFKLLAVRSIGSITVGGAVGVVMAMKGYGIMSLICQQLITALLATLFLWWGASWRPGLMTTKGHVKSLANQSFHISISAVTGFANSQSDIFFSSYYLGAVSTGIYNAAKRIISAANAMLSAGLNTVALPMFAIAKHEAEGASRAFLKITVLTSMATAPLYAGMAVLSGDIIQIVMGDQWVDVAPVLAILSISAYLATIGQYNQNVIWVYNKPHWQTALTTLYAATSVIGFILFARYGLIALSLTFTIRAILLHPLSTMPALHLLKIPAWQYIKSISPSVIAACVMVGGVYSVKPFMDGFSPLGRICILVPAGAIIYSLLLYLMDRKAVMEMISFAKEILSRNKKHKADSENDQKHDNE